MSASTIIRPAFSKWPWYNQQLRDAVGAMTEEQLAMSPTPERWPAWATIGHAACQRVFWLCVFAGEPGAETTRFTNSGYDCPGDDDLEHVLSAEDLVEALDSTFRIVDGCLDRWTMDMLDDELRHRGDPRMYTRGSVIQRVYTHDIWHIAELNEVLGPAGAPLIELWD